MEFKPPNAVNAEGTLIKKVWEADPFPDYDTDPVLFNPSACGLVRGGLCVRASLRDLIPVCPPGSGARPRPRRTRSQATP